MCRQSRLTMSDIGNVLGPKHEEATFFPVHHVLYCTSIFPPTDIMNQASQKLPEGF